MDDSCVAENIQRRKAQPDASTEEHPQSQMLRRGGGSGGAKGGSGGATPVVVMFGFVVLIVGAWWGLMSMVMGSAHHGPKRVTPGRGARALVEAAEGLEWDAVYEAHAGQVGWVLEDRGTQVEVGFPDGTTKWYPYEALDDVGGGGSGGGDGSAVADKGKRKRHHKQGRKKAAVVADDDGGDGDNDVSSDHHGEADADDAAATRKKKARRGGGGGRHQQHRRRSRGGEAEVQEEEAEVEERRRKGGHGGSGDDDDDGDDAAGAAAKSKKRRRRRRHAAHHASGGEGAEVSDDAGTPAPVHEDTEGGEEEGGGGGGDPTRDDIQRRQTPTPPEKKDEEGGEESGGAEGAAKKRHHRRRRKHHQHARHGGHDGDASAAGDGSAASGQQQQQEEGEGEGDPTRDDIQRRQTPTPPEKGGGSGGEEQEVAVDKEKASGGSSSSSNSDDTGDAAAVEEEAAKRHKKKHRRHGSHPHKRQGGGGDDSGSGSGGGGASEEEGAHKRRHRRKRGQHRHGSGDDGGGGGGAADAAAPRPDVARLSLSSALPWQKKACTYPVLHPDKWREKMGWGVKKEFAPCDAAAEASGPISEFSLSPSAVGSGSSGSDGEEADLPARATLTTDKGEVEFALKLPHVTVSVDGGKAERLGSVDMRYSIKKQEATLKLKGLKGSLESVDGSSDHFHAKVTLARPGASKAHGEGLAALRAMLEAAEVPHSVPRSASVRVKCEDPTTARVVGMPELPDKFFNKMSTTLDAEKRQNGLKALYTSPDYRMLHEDYSIGDDGIVSFLVHPYILVVCGERKAFHLNLDAEGRRFKKKTKAAAEEAGGDAHASESKKKQKKKLNIMHVMFDSSSFPALVRACPKITRKLESLNNAKDGPSRVFSFKHLHAVSCCSPGNQIPMYSGRMNGEGSPFVAAEPRQGSRNWLWNVAKTMGYQTFFSLDNCPDKSARDFQAWPSVDHRVVAPMCLSGILLSHKERPCLAHRPIDDFIFEGAEQFWDMYPQRPKYAAVQLITPHEETEKNLIELDGPMEAFLDRLEKKGVLNDTAVFFFSDHGINFGKYAQTHDGEIEKMFPYAHLVLPRWLKDTFDFEALRANENALVTPYDMHQVLRDLLHHPSPAPPYETDPSDPPLPLPTQSHIVASMKTLRPFERVLHHAVPHARTCVEANIPPEFCTCIDWTEVPAADRSVYAAHVKAAVAAHRAAVAAHGDVCEPVALGEVVTEEMQVWPLEYHPKEQRKAKKIWMAPNRDMLRVVYSLEARPSTRFEAVLSVDKRDRSNFDVAVVTRIDAMEKKCGVVEKQAEILCVCK